MDTTSPMHQNHAVWDMLSRDAFHHGSFFSSHEKDESFAAPGTFERTRELMKTMDTAGMAGKERLNLP